MERARWVEQKALEALATAGVHEPPVDPELVASRHSFRVVHRAALRPGTKAMWVQERAEILLADLEPQLLRFPCGHEVGHALLNHGDCKGFGGPASGDFPIEDADLGPNFESEANSFAGCLLVPRNWLRRDLERGLKQAELMERYGIAQSTLLIACEKYRLLKKLSA